MIDNLHGDPAARRAEGEANIARVRDSFGEERYLASLRALYS